MFNRIKCKMGFGKGQKTVTVGDVYFLTDVGFGATEFKLTIKKILYAFEFNDCFCRNHSTATMADFTSRSAIDISFSYEKLKEALRGAGPGALRIGSLVDYLTGGLRPMDTASFAFCLELANSRQVYQTFGFSPHGGDGREAVERPEERYFDFELAVTKYEDVTQDCTAYDMAQRMRKTHVKLKKFLVDSIGTFIKEEE